MKYCLAFLLGFLVVLGSFSPAEAQAPKPRDPNRWEKTIADFESADRTSPPPRNAVLFIGSSSIRGWNSLTNDFPEHKVINRGFGGSEIEDSLNYADRIVLPYRPRTIVFYAGENDLNAGKTPQQVFEHFQMFVSKVHAELPKTKIIFISLKPSPSRWKMIEQINRANALIEDFCKTDSRLKFVNVYPEMLGPDGKPKPELYKKDRLHMTEKGYELWTAMVKPHLNTVEPAPATRR